MQVLAGNDQLVWKGKQTANHVALNETKRIRINNYTVF